MRDHLNRRELLAGGAALAAGGWLLAGSAGAKPSPALQQLRRQLKGPMLLPSSSKAFVFNSRYAPATAPPRAASSSTCAGSTPSR